MLPTVLFFKCLTGLSRALAIAVFAFLMIPILIIIPLSFTSSDALIYPIPSFSFRWYSDFFHRPEWISSIQNSFIIGIGTAICATILGTAAALGAMRMPRAVQAAIGAIIMLPMAIPLVILAVSFFFFYAKLGLTGTYGGLILAHTTMALPFVFVAVRASLLGLSPDFARAATNLGAPPARVFMRVTAPLIAPGVATGALFAFATSLEDVVVAMFIAGPNQLTLPRQMYAGVRENISPTILAAATMLTVLSILLMVANGLLTRRSRAQQAAA